MKNTILSPYVALLVLTTTAIAAEPGTLIEMSGVTGGLVVDAGAVDENLGRQLAEGNPAFLVQVLLTGDVAGARRRLADQNMLQRVSVDSFDGQTLPCIDGSVNLLLAERPITAKEIQRVLAPGGVALVKHQDGWQRVAKPRPESIDDWTHYLYDAGNNPVSKDRKVGAPKHLQWRAPPAYSRSHEIESSVPAVVTADGRLVYILDEGLTGITDKRLPETWALVCRDAFSGVRLWKRPLPDWGWPQWRPDRAKTSWLLQDYNEAKSPVALPRRLVMDARRVFVTLGWKAPVSMLDAASGRTLATFEGTEGTQEILHCQGILYLVVSEKPQQIKQKSFVAAVDPTTKEILWKGEPAFILPEMFAVEGDHVYVHTRAEMLCLDRHSGKVVWRRDRNLRNDYYIGANGLVATPRAVYLINANSLLVLDPTSGKTLWQSKGWWASAGGNAPNLFEIDGLVWGSNHRSEKGFKGLEVATGKVGKVLDDQDIISRGHHIRCFRAKATSRYILWPKRGTEFLDVQGDNHSRHDWIRGSCRYGLMPANGMLYVPPHQCFCYQGVVLNGFMAVAPDRDAEPPAPKSHLEQGPAYQSEITAEVDTHAWPCYRQSNLRLGSSSTRVAAELKPGWSVELGGRLSPPVAAAGKVYVVQTELGIVNALDAETGKAQWRFITGCRIDSPPTILGGRVLFGCNDGYVYCLRAADGALAWRFRAAPYERRLVVDDRLESPWPVGGSVLSVNGLAYVLAGRSSYLDGGLFLYALDPASGTVRHVCQFDGPHLKPNGPTESGFAMEGAKADLLSTDGSRIYLFHNIFSLDLQQQPHQPVDRNGQVPQGLHVMTTGGFADDHAWNRNFWTYMRRWPGFYMANQAPKSGQLLVADATTTYAVKYFSKRNMLSPMFFPETTGYLLFADDNDNEPILYGEPGAPKPIVWLPPMPEHPRLNYGKLDTKSYNDDKRAGYTRARPSKWQRWVPVRIRAMVRTADRLFVAGPPDVLKKDDELAAFQGRAGGKLLTIDPIDGKTLSQLDLPSPPVFDGLIATQRHLYMTTRDGRVIRFGGSL